MKKILSVILVMGLLLSVATPVTFADSWKNKGGLPPGIQKKFNDISEYQWANNAIEKMSETGIMKGLKEQTFAPEKSVTKLEAIVIALRIMGYEDEAQQYLEDILDGKKKCKFKQYLQQWAYGYVTLAEDKGILDDADVLYFKLNDAVTRHEAAKYLVRAMDLEDEAQDHMNADLDYKDAAFIPQGSVGYIYVAEEDGIITGYNDGTFKPFNTVTRAEMAVMVSRIDGETDGTYSYKGEVKDIDYDDQWIKIDIGSSNKEFDIIDDVRVIFNDQDGDLEDVEVGDDATVTVVDSEVTKITVDRDRDEEIINGKIHDVYADDEKIAIKVGSETKLYSIDDEVKIYLNDSSTKLTNLKTDDNVSFKLDDGKIIEIKAYRY